MRRSGKGSWLIGAALLATGCNGPFNLTQRLHHWNDHVTEDKWANECIFFGFVIIPAYPLATLADGFFFNSVEFWSGKNWVSAPGHDYRE